MARRADGALSGRRPRDQEVIAAAVAIFARKGYAAASVQDVADELGMLKGSLYYYIDSKEDLLGRIFDDSHAEASAIVAEVSGSDAAAAARVGTFVERYAHWYLTHLPRVSIYMREWRYLEGERRRRVDAQRRFYDRFLAGLIAEAQADGDAAGSLDPVRAANFIYGAINGLPEWYRRAGSGSPGALASEYAEMALTMLGIA
jgi:TetR/AcrR family transcriptional regulator, cholesterol catabolism regulator